MTSVRAMAMQERAEFAELLAGLVPDQWNAPSLCAGWTVRDVAVHVLAYLGQSRTELSLQMLRARFDVDRLNERGVRMYAGVETEQLTKRMLDGVEPSGAAALYGARVALIECLIHQQDIRRPLGLSRSIPEDRLRAAMNYARISPVIAAARRTRGMRLVATDMDWTAGDGPEVLGPAEALLLAMTGRAAAVVNELDGEGVMQLR